MKKLWIAIGVLLLTAPLPGAPERDIEALYRVAGTQLVCQCGCKEQLTVCAMQNCHSATPMRAEIREKLLAGIAVDEIVQGFVAKMGKQVLSAPTGKGFDLVAWIMPFLALLMGAIFVSWVVKRMARPAPAPETAPLAIDPRIEKELREFEEET